ncbi:MAG TPA: phosphoglucosamine mutase, partial [Sulfurovum sp.]|nr:phosphoglucosamine mutase [Sulfurovum sp.]
DKHVLSVMKKRGSNFGGEQSGHIIFSDFAKTGDGLVSALQAFAYIISINKKTSEAFDVFELHPQLQKNIQISKKVPIDKIKGAKELLSEIDALNIRHLVRYSGTENLIRILLEGKNKKVLSEMMQKTVTFFTKELS